MKKVLTKKVLTLCIIHDTEKILLGMKKRGFGEGKWNGFGGKVELGETIEQAALREVEEESGLKLGSLNKRGVLDFTFESGEDHMEVHVFSSDDYEGEPFESDEMKPKWFAHSEIPFDLMWADDIHWMPLLLSGKNFNGQFCFKDEGTLISYSLQNT